MRFAGMAPQQSRQKTIPAFSGGLNTMEPAENIADNQLTYCKNMHFESGKLVVRPGWYTDYTSDSSNRVVYDNKGNMPEQIALFTTDDRRYILMHTKNALYVWDANGILKFEKYWNTVLDGITCSAGSFASNGRDEALFFGKYSNGNKIIKINLVEGNYSIQTVSNEYVPTVIINARPSDSMFDMGNDGTSYEGFNLLTASFKSLWTSNGSGIYYAFPWQIVPQITAKMNDDDGNTATWTIPTSGTVSTDVNFKIGGATHPLRLAYSGPKSCVWFEENDGNGNYTHFAMPSVGFSDNIELTAKRNAFSSADTDKICKSTFSSWFGGTASGTGDGTRLFLSGNADDPNVVRYSDVNNPYYFPENNFIYVGSKTEPVTAFGKQSAYLVVFKPHEIYALEYAWNAFNGDDVAAGIVPDVTADAFFPMRQINGGIGCDCPGTVQLCGNHLVWANAEDKRVYTLSNFSNYTEKNVRDISWVIEPTIRNDLNENATAAVWGDYYMLLCTTDSTPFKVYLFDFTQNGFTYYASYYDDKRASTKIPWYMWEFDVPMNNGGQEYRAFRGTMAGGWKTPFLMATYNEGGVYYTIPFDPSWHGYTDKMPKLVDGVKSTEDVEYEGRFVTKYFNFDIPGENKTIEGALLKAYGEGNISEHWGTDRDIDIYGPQNVEIRTTYAPKMVHLPCRLNRVRAFVIGIGIKGNVQFGEMIIKFRALGEVK